MASRKPVVITEARSNPLGIAGFILAIVGLVAWCFPPAAVAAALGGLLALGGLFSRPRGLAIAAIIIALFGVAGGVISGFVIGAAVATGAQAVNEAAIATTEAELARLERELEQRDADDPSRPMLEANRDKLAEQLEAMRRSGEPSGN